MPMLRSLRKNLGFSLVVISVLALGIGANTALFSISQNLFDTLGVRPALERTFLPDEFGSRGAACGRYSDRLWRKHFRADPSIIGRQILLDSKGYSVIGVMGPGFVFTKPPHQAWIPYKQHGELHTFFSNLARLRPGAAILDAQGT